MAAEGQLSPAEPVPTDTNAPVKEANSVIDIGAQYSRWIELKEDLQCGNDTLAKLLLDICAKKFRNKKSLYEIKDEELVSRPSTGKVSNRISEQRKRNASMSGTGMRSSLTSQSGSSSLMDSQDTRDSSNCSVYEDISENLGESVYEKKSESNKNGYPEGYNSKKSSRRKQPKSRVSRYLEDENEAIAAHERGDMESGLEGFDAERLKWDQDELENEGLGSRDSLDAKENRNQLSGDETEEEDDPDGEEGNDFLSEEELEKLLKGSESESDAKRSKRKRDSDSDWMPAVEEEKPRRRRSRRVSRQNSKPAIVKSRRSLRRRVSTSAEESTEVEEEVEVKPEKIPRGRPRKTRKDSVVEEEPKQIPRSQKPKLMKKSGVFSCTVCDNSFTNKEEGKEHLESHYVIDCNLCTHRFYSLQALAHHQSKKHPANHKCNHCFFTGRTRMELKRHMRKEHQDEQTIPGTTLCHICGQQFRFVVNVQKHLMDAHGIMESNMKTYMCDQCGNEYFLKHSLRKHMLTHKEKNIVCDFEGCASKFSSDAQYKRHYNTVHLKIKRHACPYEGCEMKFAFRKTMATHVNMVHLKLRLFPCPWQGCERSFYAKKHLTVHMRIHNDEKPFKCTECDYKCRQRAALNWHLKKHGIVPDHPESLENEKKNKKEGFPVNFKRGRKRTRFRKSKGLDYTDDQIASINQRYSEMVTGTSQQLYPAKDEDSSDAEADDPDDAPKEDGGADQASFDEKFSGGQSVGNNVEDFSYVERRESQIVTRPADLPPGYAGRDFNSNSPAQETFTSELPKREVDYARLDYDTSQPTHNDFTSKQVVRDGEFQSRESDFHATRDPEYQAVQEGDFQQSRDSFSSVRETSFQPVRDTTFSANREGSFPPIRDTDYQVRDTQSDYRGYPMKENLDAERAGVFPRFISKDVFSTSMHRDGHFSPRPPIKEAYITGQALSEVDYSRFAAKNELSALRTLPPGFQGQMEVPSEYDPRSPVHAVMGGNSGSYGQDLHMYSREYK
ncbi:zinc finger protein 37-like [Haliotis rufescens]|uniref:zinc finger protein 37-like n=1 Tax=Haliotis rufescens TaxID=6454 RepID=UPI00201EDE3C|nr:zinc finger protein 37-like [Haliotis rufescens]